MTRRPASSLTLLALLALGWAQVFGLTRGYWCDCSGVAQVSQFDHCHGHHGGGCHHDDTPSHSHEDHDADDGETHQHAPAQESLDAQTFASLSAPLPPAVAVEVLPVFQPRPGDERRQEPCPRPPSLTRDQRWPCVLSRTVALRI